MDIELAQALKENAELKKDNEILTKVINNVHVVRIKQLTKENADLKAQIKKMKSLLEKWHKQHSDKTYTQTFYDELIKATEEFLWSENART